MEKETCLLLPFPIENMGGNFKKNATDLVNVSHMEYGWEKNQFYQFKLTLSIQTHLLQDELIRVV